MRNLYQGDAFYWTDLCEASRLRDLAIMEWTYGYAPSRQSPHFQQPVAIPQTVSSPVLMKFFSDGANEGLELKKLAFMSKSAKAEEQQEAASTGYGYVFGAVAAAIGVSALAISYKRQAEAK